ncbi:MAG TPA: hypothetical protein VEX64_09115 [Pyrinomonadaceae bacterium]|nr:hypothetical protein [Pyrinomonadaceae bacterium]
MRRVVIQRDGDNGFRAFKKKLRIGSLFRLALHPEHLAVKIVFKPRFEMIALARQLFGAGNADFMKTDFSGFLFDLLCEFDFIHALKKGKRLA